MRQAAEAAVRPDEDRATRLSASARWANPGGVENLLLNPRQAGKSQALHLVRTLSAFTVPPAPESGDKLTRFGPFSSQCRAGNVKIRRGSWNEELFRVLEGFPDLAHDDEVDACSGALEMLNPGMKTSNRPCPTQGDHTAPFIRSPCRRGRAAPAAPPARSPAPCAG